MSDRLRRYIKLRLFEVGSGWLAKYEKDLRFRADSDAQYYARLCGHYEGMIGELLDLIGTDTATALLDADDSLRRLRKKLQEEQP